MPIPDSLKREHRELHEMLERATREPGELGEAARIVAEKMFPHFVKEEEFALPPLGLLTVTGVGPTKDVDEVIAMTDRLGKEMPRMLEEHAEIARALATFSERAKRAGRKDYVAFADNLLHHARMEEEIMYPAALLIGSYLRQKKVQRK